MSSIHLNRSTEYPKFLEMVNARPSSKKYVGAKRESSELKRSEFEHSRVGKFQDFQRVYADAQRKPRGGGVSSEQEAWQRLEHFLGGIN